MPSRPPTSDHLRHDIDRGRGRDDIDFFDPAVDDTDDDEAARVPPPPKSLRLAHDFEIDRPATSGRDESAGRGVLIAIVVIIGLAIGFAIGLWLL